MKTLKKSTIIFFSTFIVVLLLTGCGKEITLNLAFGDRTGTYSGDVNEDGLPHGQGKFTSTNVDGQKWTYEGEFKDGHFNGEGKTTWEDGQVVIGTYKNDVIVPLKGEEIKSLYTSPENFKNYYVEVIGKVFTAPEYMDDIICIQMWTDLENYENNTIVYISDTDFEVSQDDYIRIIGKVGDPFTGQNMMGGEITVPTIIAEKFEVIDYKDAVAPTLKTIELNQTINQLGYSVTVQKIEFAEKETRIYVKIDNQGSDTFNLYSFNSKITQNKRQYEEQENWDADYPEIQTDLLVGNITEGVIVFPTLEESDFTIIFEASSDNWNEDIEPFTFNITFE